MLRGDFHKNDRKWHKIFESFQSLEVLFVSVKEIRYIYAHLKEKTLFSDYQHLFCYN